jgi:hypothetical protein
MKFLPLPRPAAKPKPASVDTGKRVERSASDAALAGRQAQAEPRDATQDTAQGTTLRGEIPPIRQTDGHHL